jgi:hypothetical protein
VGLLATLLGLLLVTGVRAQGGVTPTPDQITVAGQRGAVETRTVLLQATDPITDLQIIPLDLHRADGETVLPASAIQVELSSDEIASNAPLTVPVTVDLHGVPSGKFSGKLLVRYHGGTLNLPLSVTVKDRWLPPLLVLAVGIGLSVGVSSYRAKGRPRDRVLTRVGQLRAQMRGDAELAEPFQTRIEAHLVDVESALQAENWEEAKQAVKKAEATWIRWRKGRDDWLAQLTYHSELIQKLQDEPDVPYIQTLRRDLEDALRETPDMEGPHKLRERLDEVAQQINRYVRLQGQLDELNELRTRLPADQTEQWRLKAQSFQRRVHDLDPKDEQAYDKLQKELEKAIGELAQQASQRRGVVKTSLESTTRGLGAKVLELLAPPPSAREITTEATTDAGRRLRLFTWASYAIAVAMLAGAGFGELYVANATFGANAWGDYFALLAWGFGAEATRAAVTEMVHGWGLPGLE